MAADLDIEGALDDFEEFKEGLVALMILEVARACV